MGYNSAVTGKRDGTLEPSGSFFSLFRGLDLLLLSNEVLQFLKEFENDTLVSLFFKSLNKIGF